MATASTSGEATIRVDPTTVIPGTTFPLDSQQDVQKSRGEPSYFDGPIVNDKATTVGLYAPDQVTASGHLQSLYELVNECFCYQAFATSQSLTAMWTNGAQRLSKPAQFVEELGTGPDTFTYVVFYSGTDTVIGTASACRLNGPILIAKSEKGYQEAAFERLRTPGTGSEEFWELKTMVTDTKLQRQGLATYMIRLVENEVKTRSRARRVDKVDVQSQRLMMLLTTIKEINGAFYERRGYATDFTTWCDKDRLGSAIDIHIIHMSKYLS